MCCIDNQKVDTCINQTFGTLIAVFTNARGSSSTQTTLCILGSIWIELRLFNVLDRNEAYATPLIVDNQQLFDAVSMQQALGFILLHVFTYSDEVFARHQFIDFLRRIGSKPHITIGQNADETARTFASIFDNRDTGNAVCLHDCLCVGKRRIWSDRDRVYHHAGFKLLDLADFLGLTLRCQIAMNNTNATRLRHSDGQTRFRHGVHCCGEQRQIKLDIFGNTCVQIDLSGHHFGMARLQKHIIKSESERASGRFHDFCHCQFLYRFYRMRKAASPVSIRELRLDWVSC